MRRQRRLLSTFGLTSKEDTVFSFRPPSVHGQIRELLICVCSFDQLSDHQFLFETFWISPISLTSSSTLLLLLSLLFSSGLWILTEKCGGCVKGMRAGRMPKSSEPQTQSHHLGET